MLTADEIVERYRLRLRAASPTHNAMRDMLRAYSGDLVVPLAEMDASQRAAIPNLIRQGVESYAQRTASVMPEIGFEPVNTSKRARQNAKHRRQAMLGMWDANKQKRQLQRRARYLFAYCAAPAMIWPDFGGLDMPKWKPLNPLQVLPAPTDDDESFLRTDAIVCSQRPASWLMAEHPELASQMFGNRLKPDDSVELLLYTDAEIIATVVVGMARDDGLEGHQPVSWTLDSQRSGAFISIAENRVGRCLVTFPQSVTLSNPVSQFAGMIGMYEAEAELEAIQRIAARKAVLSEEWLVGRSQETPELLIPADPMRGQVGMVKGADLVNRTPDPQFMANIQIDRMERNQRVEGGVSPDLGGESGSNIRTGRRGSQLQSAVMDFPIAEAMDVLAQTLQDENTLAIEVDKAYWGESKRTFNIDFPGPAKGKLEYVPNELWTTSRNRVRYPMTGVDAQGLVISTAQRVGSGMMSVRSAMEMDPMVEDAEQEHDLILAERLESALLDTFIAEATNPENPRYTTIEVAKLMEWVRTDKMELDEAIVRLQKEQLEAQQAEQGTPQSQQGLGLPAPELTPQIQGPSSSIENLDGLLSRMRRPQALATPGEAISV